MIVEWKNEQQQKAVSAQEISASVESASGHYEAILDLLNKRHVSMFDGTMAALAIGIQGARDMGITKEALLRMISTTWDTPEDKIQKDVN